MSNQDKLQEFRFFEAVPNTSGGIASPVGSDTLATFAIHVDPGDVVALVGNVGWQADAGGNVELIVSINRSFFSFGPNITTVFQARDSADSDEDNKRVTSLSHVDSGFATKELVTYNLVITSNNPATIIGPITFFGEKISTS